MTYIYLIKGQTAFQENIAITKNGEVCRVGNLPPGVAVEIDATLDDEDGYIRIVKLSTNVEAVVHIHCGESVEECCCDYDVCVDECCEKLPEYTCSIDGDCCFRIVRGEGRLVLRNNALYYIGNVEVKVTDWPPKWP